MKRILWVLAVASVIAAIVVVTAGPAMARSFFIPLENAGTVHLVSTPSGITREDVIAIPPNPVAPPEIGPCKTANLGEDSTANPNCQAAPEPNP